jgi:hypothetical protein
MRGPINVKSPNNITNWQMIFNSAFKGLNKTARILVRREKHTVADFCNQLHDSLLLIKDAALPQIKPF